MKKNIYILLEILTSLFRACSTTHSGPLTAKSVLAYLARRTSVCENFRSAFRRNWARINAANARMSPSSSSWYTAAIVERLNLLSVDLLPCILCGSLSCSRHVASVSSRCSFRCPNLFCSARVICWSQASFADLGSQVSLCSGVTRGNHSPLLQDTLQPSLRQIAMHDANAFTFCLADHGRSTLYFQDGEAPSLTLSSTLCA